MNSLKSAQGNIVQIRHVWTIFAIILVGVSLVILLIYFVMNPIDSIDIDRYLQTLRPDPWPEPPDPAALAGCYELTIGEWFPVMKSSTDACYTTASRKVELTTKISEESKEWLIMRIAPGADPYSYYWTSWRITSTNTLLLIWSSGGSGIEIELGPARDDLMGYAKTFWDFPKQERVANVIARRINCQEVNNDCYPITARDLRRSDAPTFEQYRVWDRIDNIAPVDLNSHPQARKYKTILTKGAGDSPNFAGFYTVLGWGCGTSCVSFAIINRKTAKVIFPEGISNISTVNLDAEDFEPNTESLYGCLLLHP